VSAVVCAADVRAIVEELGGQQVEERSWRIGPAGIVLVVDDPRHPFRVQVTHRPDALVWWATFYTGAPDELVRQAIASAAAASVS
jgi:hypothetical protein